MRFGIEIETISKLNINDITCTISDIIGEKRVDMLNHYYHGHSVNLWGIESDCSLHGNNNYSYGTEIISPPMQIHELGEVKKIMVALKGKISANGSCGLHVHVEVKDIRTVKNILKIWRKFEDQILKSFPVSRQDNRYCRKLKGMNSQRLFAMKYGRYYMVNCAPWPYKGTVEFRGHNGTTNYNKIKRWVLFCLSLVKKASEYTDRDAEFQSLLRKRNIDIWQFLNENGKTKKYFEGRKVHFNKIEKRRSQCAV